MDHEVGFRLAARGIDRQPGHPVTHSGMFGVRSREGTARREDKQFGDAVTPEIAGRHGRSESGASGRFRLTGVDPGLKSAGGAAVEIEFS